MYIYRFFSLLFSSIIIFQLSLPSASNAATADGFKTYEVALMNSYKSSHQLFQDALKAKQISVNAKKVMLEQLSKKSVSLPEFKLMKDGSVQFKLESRKHNLSREAKNTFRLDGKLVDMNAKTLRSDVGLLLPNLFTIPAPLQYAHADGGLTAIVVIALIIIVVGVSCSASTANLSGASGAKHISLGTAADQVMNDFLRDVRRQMCRGGCGAACASPAGGNFDHMAYLTGKLCPEAARYYVDIAEIDRHAEELEPVVTPNEERKTKFMANISRIHQRHSADLTMDEVDRQILAGLVSDPNVMRWCVARTFDGAQEAEAPAGSKAPVNQ